jgi:hypothetical protein
MSIAGPKLDVFSFRSPTEPAGTIGMPCRDTINAGTVISIATSALAPGWFENRTVIDFNICRGNVLTMQRNDLVQRMRGDWLLFIDDDMIWQPDQIVQLIKTRDELDLDVLGALCFRRAAPHQPTMFMRESPTGGRFNYMEVWPDDQAVEVDGTGMAFVVIHKRVFERIVAYYDNVPGWTMPSFETRLEQAPPNFFRWNGGFGEDLQFCIDAKLSGSRIFVDTSVEILHAAEIQVGREQFFLEVAKRGADVEESRQAANDAMGLPTLTRAVARERLGW